MGTLTYLKSFLKDKDVASVTPTSKYCIRKVCRPIDYSRDLKIVEYGAGSGVFSKYLLERLSRGSDLILFETNPTLFSKLKEIDDDRVTLYNESVEQIKELLGGEAGKETVDYIISGIPFSFLEQEQKYAILNQSKFILKEGGRFLAYQTSGHLKVPLRDVFGNVSTGFELRNIPPMTVYEAVK